jgi:hypothetical protein
MQNTFQFNDEILAQKNLESGIPRLGTEVVKNKIGHGWVTSIEWKFDIDEQNMYF